MSERIARIAPDDSNAPLVLTNRFSSAARCARYSPRRAQFITPPFRPLKVALRAREKRRVSPSI